MENLLSITASARPVRAPLPTTLFLTTALLATALPVAPLAAQPAGPVFVDRAEASGLVFEHDNGLSGKFYFPEIAGSGAALFDYDGDGDLDAYLVQGGPVDPAARRAAAEAGELPGDRLFRNDLVPTGKLRFTDVTTAAGLGATGYGMGVAAGDVDGDGDLDLYIANLGSNQLWRNDGDGTFTDVTAAAGADDDRWSIGASFVDYDRDGDLDLYVVNYVVFDLEKNPRCFSTSSRRDYCGPSAFPPIPDSLFRNRGDGTFEDVSVPSGVGRQAGAGLGVVSADFDGDGWPDLYVANDGQANFLWLNQGDGTFRDDALFAGVAVNRQGSPEASMGVDAADADGDGDPDLFMTHLMGESNTLYLNDGSALFEDRTLEAGLATGSFPYTSFGTLFSDFDNDGRPDLWIGNGAVRILEERAAAGDDYPLDQPDQLFWQDAAGRFVEITDRGGEALVREAVTRGAAYGDVDDDGDPDILVSDNRGRARLLINRVGQDRPWLGLRLTTGEPPGDALGAVVELKLDGGTVGDSGGDSGRRRLQRVRTDGGYASAHDPRVIFGLGERGGDLRGHLEVLWPDGSRERFPLPATGRYTTLRQGTGTAVASPDTASPAEPSPTVTSDTPETTSDTPSSGGMP